MIGHAWNHKLEECSGQLPTVKIPQTFFHMQSPVALVASNSSLCGLPVGVEPPSAAPRSEMADVGPCLNTDSGIPTPRCAPAQSWVLMLL